MRGWTTGSMRKAQVLTLLSSRYTIEVSVRMFAFVFARKRPNPSPPASPSSSPA